MRSVTSYFNAALFRKNLLRFWPLWAFYAAICLFCAPLPLFLNLINGYGYGGEAVYAARDVLEVGVTGGLFLAAFFGIFYAMAEFSYLTNSRATQGFHALPICREALFLTQYLSGLFSMVFSLAVAALLSGLILALGGAFHAKALLLAFGAAVLETLFFYSFGVFCMICTGQILAAPVFYGILNFLAIGLEMLLRSFGGMFLFGYYSSYSQFATAPLSPFFNCIDLIRIRYIYERVPNLTSVNGYDEIPVDVTVEGFSLLVLYAAVGLLFAAAALWLYRRRHSEETSTVVAITWARPIFKYGVSLCAAFSLGQLMYIIIFEGFLYSRPNIVGAVVCMIFAGLVGYFAAEMLLKKRFRVWRGARGGALVICAILAVFGYGMATDITGYENYIPDVDEIESVDVNFWSNAQSVYGEFYDETTIAAVQNVQRAFLADKDRWIDSEYSSRPYDYDSSKDLTSVSFRVTYYLKDGTSVHRRYYADYIPRSDLADPTSLASRATDLLNSETVTVTRVFGDYATKYDLDAVTFTGGYVNAWNNTNGAATTVDLDAAQSRALYRALKDDLLAGHADHVSIFDGALYDGKEIYSDMAAENDDIRIDAELWFKYSREDQPDISRSETVTAVPAIKEYPNGGYTTADEPYNGGLYIDIGPNLTYARAYLASISDAPELFS